MQYALYDTQELINQEELQSMEHLPYDGKFTN